MGLTGEGKLCPAEESGSSERILKLVTDVKEFYADVQAFEKFSRSHFEHTQEKPATVCVYPNNHTVDSRYLELQGTL